MKAEAKERKEEKTKLETKPPVRRKTKRPRYKVITKELKLTMVYTQRIKTGKARYGLKDRFIYGSLAKAEEFSESFAEKVYRIYKPSLKETKGVVLGDGAIWINNMKDMFFPFARFQLDLWHITKRLRDLFCRWDEPVSGAMRLLWEGEKEGFFDLLRDSFRAMPNTSCKERENFYGYILLLERNWETIVGFRTEKGDLRKFSTQGIEKQMDLFVKRRFKGQGMSWSPEGLDNLLYMRALMINQQLAPWMNPSLLRRPLVQKELYSIGVRE